jgi:hypothetical protein
MRWAAIVVVGGSLARGGCNEQVSSTAACTGPYPTAPATCDASAQCVPVACTCGDGTRSDFARSNLCTDAGACDPLAVCNQFCGPAGGLQSICR